MAPRKPVKGGPGQWNVGRAGGIGNDSPFKGRDPFSQIASFVWRLPGAIASGRTLQGRKVTAEEWSSLAANVALVGAGIYAGTRGVRGTRPAAGKGAFRSGARPMTTAERSAAVTRAGRTGVGKIGPSIKPLEPRTDPEGGDYPGIASEPFDSYETAWYRGHAALNRKAAATRTPITLPSQITDVSTTGNSARYRGFTTRFTVFDDWDDSGFAHVRSTFRGIPEYMKKTLDWRATRAPLRRTASAKRKVGK